jgi:S1-C subfamily serine protease
MPKAASMFLAALLGGAVVAAVLLLTGAGGGTDTTTVVQSGEALPAKAVKGTLSPRTIYRRDAPGVVFVQARISEGGQSGLSRGSGFVIGRGGSLVTNAHVVGNAKKVQIKFSDAKVATAKVAGTDPSTDLALLLVDPGDLDLHALELGSSADVAVGDPALAIGNPFGLERTLTTGVISAKARKIDSLQQGFQIGNVLQTDAAINPGNSGGPLLDAQGRIIGVNSQIETSGGGGSVGIGFAVPVDTLKEVIPRLRREGAIERAYLGVDTLTVDPSLESLDLPVSDGALVQTVTPGSPADRAGLRPSRRSAVVGGERVLFGGDIIRAIDGKRVRSNDDLAQQVGAKRPGDRVRITYLRGHDEHTAQVTLAKRPGAAG